VCMYVCVCVWVTRKEKGHWKSRESYLYLDKRKSGVVLWGVENKSSG
jgi:hypothetical protein